jgi:hypothetical protein
MRLSPSRRATAALPPLAALAIALGACADPIDPGIGAVRPNARVGQDMTG